MELKGHKLLECAEMTDAHWIKFRNKFNEVNSIDSEDNNREDLKENYVENLTKLKNEKYNFVVVLDANENPVAWFDIVISGKAMFDFENFAGKIDDEVLDSIYKYLRDFLISNGEKEIYLIENDKDLIHSFLSSGAEVYDEPLLSRLERSEIDINTLKMICSETFVPSNLELMLFKDIPEELHKSYVELVNEVSVDKEFFHPKKKKPAKLDSESLKKAIRIKNDNGHPYYMMALTDNGKLAAFSSAYIRNEGKSLVHRGGLGLTAVGRKYRGKGLAKFLKAKLYLKMLELEPDFENIITDTYPWNKFMYNINESMGFKPYIKEYRFRFTLEFLEKRSKNFLA